MADDNYGPDPDSAYEQQNWPETSRGSSSGGNGCLILIASLLGVLALGAGGTAIARSFSSASSDNSATSIISKVEGKDGKFDTSRLSQEECQELLQTVQAQKHALSSQGKITASEWKTLTDAAQALKNRQLELSGVKPRQFALDK
jgi:uncharacterized protein HemX